MTRAIDRLTLLETFARIAERGSITAAAIDLGLSQASASRQLADLESRLGVQLIHRTTHELTLTPAGHELLADAHHMLNAWESLFETHASTGNAIKGQLKVVAPVAFGQLHLADLACAYQKQFPHIRLSWHLQDGPIRFSEIGCDCWLKIGPVPDDRLVVRELAQIERLLVAAPSLFQGRRVDAPAALEDEPFLALDGFESALHLTSGSQDTARLAPTIRMQTNNIFALKKAAVAGLGISVLPRWLIAEELAIGDLVDVLPAWRAQHLSLYAAYLPGKHQPLKLKTFLAMATEATAAFAA